MLQWFRVIMVWLLHIDVKPLLEGVKCAPGEWCCDQGCFSVRFYCSLLFCPSARPPTCAMLLHSFSCCYRPHWMLRRGNRSSPLGLSCLAWLPPVLCRPFEPFRTRHSFSYYRVAILFLPYCCVKYLKWRLLLHLLGSATRYVFLVTACCHNFSDRCKA